MNLEENIQTKFRKNRHVCDTNLLFMKILLVVFLLKTKDIEKNFFCMRWNLASMKQKLNFAKWWRHFSNK